MAGILPVTMPLLVPATRDGSYHFANAQGSTASDSMTHCVCSAIACLIHLLTDLATELASRYRLVSILGARRTILSQREGLEDRRGLHPAVRHTRGCHFCGSSLVVARHIRRRRFSQGSAIRCIEIDKRCWSGREQ